MTGGSSSSSSSRIVVKLVSKEGTVHEVPMAAAKLSHLIATTIEDIDDPYGNDNEVQEVIDDDHEIPLPNISDVVLTKIIEYCNHYTIVEAMTAIETPLQSIKIEELVQSWYADFVAETDHEVLFELVTASNFMDIKPLLDLTCLAVSSVIKGQTCQNLRQMFDSDDLTPEEETQVFFESDWDVVDADGDDGDGDSLDRVDEQAEIEE